MGELTVKGVAATRKPGRYGDGNGLYLVIDSAGRRYWHLRYMIAGRRRDMSLGSADRIALADARLRAVAAKTTISNGVDPLAEKRIAQAGVTTFAQAALRVHGLRLQAWKNGKHQDQWISTLERFVFPAIGNKPVADVARSDVVAVLEPIWFKLPETSRRVKQRIGTVIDWAVGAGLRENGIEMRLVDRALPGRKGEPEHMRALRAAHVPAFIRALHLARSSPTVRVALELQVLTASRPGNVRRMKWDQLDLKKRIWVRPGVDMKNGKPHAVPLQPRAVDLLRELRESAHEDAQIVFPGTSKDGLMSENTLNKAIKHLDFDATSHGFRTSFKEWSLSAGWPDHLSESQLAHTDPNKARAAYAREDLLEERRPMMEAWAEFIGGGVGNSVRKGRAHHERNRSRGELR